MARIWSSPDGCAQAVLDTVPLVMRAVRTEMRSRRGPDLSVPQFRVLVFVRRQPGASLSEVAQQVGMTLPSMSKLVGGLVARGLVSRTPSKTDRRRLVLILTLKGNALVESARRGAQAGLARRLSGLSQEDREAVAQALSALDALFSSGEGMTS
ncbi:MAG: MarR family transcriptional regulator [Candidatus Bipolaricaulota bacterium]|nr:MarR family transcriptional regulator [Candidatus Bipolaricaulota bacterium]